MFGSDNGACTAGTGSVSASSSMVYCAHGSWSGSHANAAPYICKIRPVCGRHQHDQPQDMFRVLGRTVEDELEAHAGVGGDRECTVINVGGGVHQDMGVWRQLSVLPGSRGVSIDYPGVEVVYEGGVHRIHRLRAGGVYWGRGVRGRGKPAHDFAGSAWDLSRVTVRTGCIGA